MKTWEVGSGKFTAPSAHAKGPFVGALICPGKFFRDFPEHSAIGQHGMVIVGKGMDRPGRQGPKLGDDREQAIVRIFPRIPGAPAAESKTDPSVNSENTSGRIGRSGVTRTSRKRQGGKILFGPVRMPEFKTLRRLSNSWKRAARLSR